MFDFDGMAREIFVAIGIVVLISFFTGLGLGLLF
ncbi:hypothetical protein oselot_152 [Salmonella phage oselot]|uniref:Uncharacterized protein n=6 Tax=Viruses TaxID=10239 RepID=A0A6G8RDQ0_9CAUD|nr:hypothetical protein HOU65_gp039 [Salmonella phage Seafire]YP_009858035.1 hypothetical protein HWD22_gp108 [Salmonella phage bombadil]YP_009858860.1 hypothetical protein HWD27_gp115 [Salmonella phage oselot]YP_009859030.1 hypothetical protein HWD28_gp119 [Salmonella phage atrejo]QDB70705.1 hypothetical protein SB6_035 [Salmonella phage vB_SenS_SB6]QQV89286.1 hypothetical protein vBSTyj51_17 [Salmonella phage vB STyj5-1]AZF87928.1 hypothetical protein CPT_Seafire_039 [Salmonella phage Seafi